MIMKENNLQFSNSFISPFMADTKIKTRIKGKTESPPRDPACNDHIKFQSVSFLSGIDILTSTITIAKLTHVPMSLTPAAPETNL